MARPNMSLTKNKMPVQDPEVRNGNYDEVALGYSHEQAVDEASRCIGCKKPVCIDGCPVAVDIPGFIAKIKEGEIEESFKILYATNSLPAVCGRVCPQETQCEQLCVRGLKGEPVAIGRLERFAADFHLTHNKGDIAPPARTNGHKVAVVGSGPAGLTCAGDLARMGYSVTIFEALHKAGGVLVYGIPQFRLPKEIVRDEIDALIAMGVVVEPNVVIGKTVTVDELFEQGYEAIFIGSGAGLPQFLRVPGENLNGVYSANEMLTRVNLMKAYEDGSATPVQRARKVVVVGGGNVAMDAARCAKRLGSEEVHIVYRRSEEELPARVEEVHHAKEEGIIFNLLCNPTEILGNDKGFVRGLTCLRMSLGEPDASGRRRPVPIEGSEFFIEADQVVVAIGTSPNPLIKNTTEGLETNRWGCIVADEKTGKTSREGVYAGGDTVTGAATVILAMGAGKASAIAIDEYIKQK